MITYDCRKTIAAQMSQKFSFKKRCGSLKAVNLKEDCCDKICREKNVDCNIAAKLLCTKFQHFQALFDVNQCGQLYVCLSFSLLGNNFV